MRGRGWLWPGFGVWRGGNPGPFCRCRPWLPRRWWARPSVGSVAPITPQMTYDRPYNYPVHRLW